MECILKTGGFELAAAADVSQDALSMARAKFGVESTFSDASEMMDTVPLDCVSIITPLRYHAPIIMEAAKHGLHVIVEKPLSADVESGRAAISAMESAGKVLAVGYTFRFTENTRLMKEIIDSGEIGRVLEVRYISYGGNPWKESQNMTERVREDTIYGTDGGIVYDCGVHAFDMFNWYSGSTPVRVSASGACTKGYPFPDSATAHIVYKNGVRAVYDYGSLTRSTPINGVPLVYMFIVNGTEGSLTWSYGRTSADGLHRDKDVLRVSSKSGCQDLYPKYDKVRDVIYSEFKECVCQNRLTGHFPTPLEALAATELGTRVVAEMMDNLVGAQGTI